MVAVQIYILPVIGTSRAQLVKAASVAGQIPLTSFKSGLLPFSPIVHASVVTANPPFGMVVGQSYTFRYPGSATFANGDLCPGDMVRSSFFLWAASS